jgi:hypothetical protein
VFEPEYSVYWYDDDGTQYEELRFVTIERAVHAARRLTHGPASVLGVVKRVLITDGGDGTVFLWMRDRDPQLQWPNREGKIPDAIDA